MAVLAEHLLTCAINQIESVCAAAFCPQVESRAATRHYANGHRETDHVRSQNQEMPALQEAVSQRLGRRARLPQVQVDSGMALGLYRSAELLEVAKHLERWHRHQDRVLIGFTPEIWLDSPSAIPISSDETRSLLRPAPAREQNPKLQLC